VPTPDRPLTVGEVFAEAARAYGERIWAAFGLGAVTAAAFLLALAVHPLISVVFVALAFTAGWAAATRLVVGDSFSGAWAHVAAHAPVLLVLTVVASIPFSLALSQLVLILLAVAWLAFMGFAIPVAVVESGESQRFIDELGFQLRRSIALARAEYLHAVGVIAALVIAYILVGILLIATLRGVAGNSGVAAVAIAQVVLAPFFFLGLAVLYFEQRARAEAAADRPHGEGGIRRRRSR
jgi:hypothetical protein